MRIGTVLAALAVIGVALSAPAPVHAQTTGTTKIRKECEAKADKQKLRGLSHQAYVEQCTAALSFDTRYGVMQSK